MISSNVRQFVLVAIPFLLSLPGTIQAEQLPIDDFVRHGDYLELKISPDGEHLAARMRHEGTVFLMVMRTADNEVVGGTRPRSNSEIHTVTWVNDERLVYELAEKVPGIDAPRPTGELFGIDFDGGRKKTLYGFRAGDSDFGSRLASKEDDYASQQILSVLPADKRNILIIEYPWSFVLGNWYDSRSEQPFISKLNVYSGKKKKIEVLPYKGAEVVASADGTVNFISWASEDGVFHAASRKNGEGDWQKLDVPFTDYTPDPVAVNAEATKAYLLAPYGERQVENLFELDLTTGEYTPLFDEPSGSINDWVVDPVTQQPVVGISHVDRSHFHYVDDPSNNVARIHKMLVRSFRDKDVAITSWTRDGKAVLFRLYGDTDPGEFHVLNMETKRAEFLWANRSWIDPRKMQPMQYLEFQSDDGVAYDGFLTLPALAEGEPSPPLLVTLHGGPHQLRDAWDFNTEVQLFANRGYAVLQVNYRGSGGYGRVFQQLGYREWGGKMIDDIVNATRDVIAGGKVDPERVCVYGGSYGGYAAMMSAATAPDLYDCAIGFAGVYDLRLMFEEGDIPEVWGGVGYLEQVIGRDEQQLAAFSPVSHADKIDAAVMLIHGSEDRRAPVEHARAMRKALQQAGKDAEWKLFGRGEHGLYDLDSRREMYEGMLEFLAIHIGAGQP